MTRKKALLGVALAAVLFAAWMLWPRPLAGAFDADQPFTVHVTDLGIRDGSAFIETGDPVAVEPGTPEAEAVKQALAGHSYHLCLDTLTGADSLDGIGTRKIALYGQDGTGLNIFSGNTRIYCGGRYVRLDYWGKGRGAALCEELLAAVGIA